MGLAFFVCEFRHGSASSSFNAFREPEGGLIP